MKTKKLSEKEKQELLSLNLDAENFNANEVALIMKLNKLLTKGENSYNNLFSRCSNIIRQVHLQTEFVPVNEIFFGIFNDEKVNLAEKRFSGEKIKENENNSTLDSCIPALIPACIKLGFFELKGTIKKREVKCTHLNKFEPNEIYDIIDYMNFYKNKSVILKRLNDAKNTLVLKSSKKNEPITTPINSIEITVVENQTEDNVISEFAQLKNEINVNTSNFRDMIFKIVNLSEKLEKENKQLIEENKQLKFQLQTIKEKI